MNDFEEIIVFISHQLSPTRMQLLAAQATAASRAVSSLPKQIAEKLGNIQVVGCGQISTMRQLSRGGNFAPTATQHLLLGMGSG